MAAAIQHGPFEHEHEQALPRTDISVQLKLPDVPGIELVPSRLLADDELDLRWFLDDPRLATIRGSSDFGAQLKRAESYGYGALPCRACGGRWSRRYEDENGKEVITGWRDGTGWMPKKHFGRQESYAAALARYRYEKRKELKIVIVSKHPDDGTHQAIVDAFRKRGERAMTEADLRAAFPALPQPGEDDWKQWSVPCPACDGIGVVERRLPRHAAVTVWPTGSSKRPGAREAVGVDELVARAARRGTAVWDGYSGVSLTELERYVSVERVLKDVAGLSVTARVVLEEYYGPKVVRRHGQPQRLSHGTPVNAGSIEFRGQGFQALWPMTTVGATAKTEEEKSRRAAEVAALYQHGCRVYNIAAYGSGS